MMIGSKSGIIFRTVTLAPRDRLSAAIPFITTGQEPQLYRSGASNACRARYRLSGQPRREVALV